MSTPLKDELLRKAMESAAETEKFRGLMMQASDRRAEDLFLLAATGMSMRSIAAATGVTLSVVQRLLDKARASRPVLERREDRVSYELHRAVVEKIMEDPAPVMAKARANLRRMLSRSRNDCAAGWLREWETLLEGPATDVIKAMLQPDERGIDMRQMTPFTGVLTQDERLIAIHKAQKTGLAA